MDGPVTTISTSYTVVTPSEFNISFKDSMYFVSSNENRFCDSVLELDCVMLTKKSVIGCEPNSTVNDILMELVVVRRMTGLVGLLGGAAYCMHMYVMSETQIQTEQENLFIKCCKSSRS